MQKSMITLCGLLFGLMAAGCQKPVVEGPSHLIEPIDAHQLGYALTAARDLNIQPGRSIAHITVHDGLVIIVESPTNLVTAVSTRNGEVKWRQVVGHRAQRLFRPKSYEQQILINTQADLYLLSAETGEIQQRQRLEALVSTAPAISDRLAIFGASDGLIFAHNARSGFSEWRRRLSDQISAEPVEAFNFVFLTDEQGRGAMHATLNGDLIWNISFFGPVTVPAATNNLTLYVACEDTALYAISRQDGGRRWVHRTEHQLTQSPIVIGDLVYLNVPDVGMQAIELDEPTVRWQFAERAQPVTLIGGRLLVNNTNQLLLLDTETGRTFAQTPVQPLKTVLALEAGRLLLISPTGRMLWLDPIHQTAQAQ